MNPSTITHPTTRPVSGLTGKGRAYAILLRVRDRWEQLTPDQRAEVADLVARLSVAMRREHVSADVTIAAPRPLPLVGRLSA